jgi:hypothetical protein
MVAWVYQLDFALLLWLQVACCGAVRHRGARHNVSSSVNVSSSSKLVGSVVDSKILLEALSKNPSIKLNHFAVNFGAGDGFSAVPMSPGAHDWNGHADPTWTLFKDQHFAGVAVEGNAALLPVLNQNLPATNITKMSAWITPYTVLELLKVSNAPIDMDYFKNDIDSYDCTIVATVLRAGYRPKVLHMEVNPEIPFPIAFGVNYSPKYKSALGAYAFYGCSVTLASAIAMPFGYEPVGVSHTHDVVFMRKDVLGSMQPLTVKQVQEAEEACCMANHFGQLLNRQIIASLAADPAKVLEAVKPALQAGCIASQGESAPGVCNVPYMASLNPLDWSGQFDQILAKGPNQV